MSRKKCCNVLNYEISPHLNAICQDPALAELISVLCLLFVANSFILNYTFVGPSASYLQGNFTMLEEELEEGVHYGALPFDYYVTVCTQGSFQFDKAHMKMYVN